LTTSEAVQLIPREVLFGNPDRASPRISPDGRKLSFLAPVDGFLNVWVGDATDVATARPITSDRARGIRIYFWAFDSEHILYMQDQGGDEDWHVYSVDIATQATVDLTPIKGVHAQVQELSHHFPGEIVVGLNDRDPQLHDLYRVNIATGQREIIARNEGFAGYVTDDSLQVRFAYRLTSSGGSELLRPTPSGDWELFIPVPPEDLLTTTPSGFDKSRRTLYMIDSRDRDTSALVTIDSESGERTVIAENPRADVSEVLTHPTEKTVEAVAFTYDRKHWMVLDDRVGGDLQYLKTVAGGEIEIVSRTLDDTQWIVAFMMDDGPMRYYRCDRRSRQDSFLFSNRKRLEGLPLSKMHAAVIKTRDGLDMVCYYTLPYGSDARSPGTPDRPLPMVLDVHGGPGRADEWGYNPMHQLMANRGYAVMSVNFRGSTGLGKRFTNAGNMEWAGKMHDDLLDAMEWAVGQGIADRNRVAVFGGSYGGYAALVGLTFTPDTFACGVDIVGPSSLVTLLESIPPYWAPQIEVFATRVGDHRNEEGRKFLKERSPLTYVERINRPLLIVQGAKDPRVKQTESVQIVQALRGKGIPVTYVLFPDEGHGFARPENNMAFNAVAEAFLAAHLGGRYEAVGDDFKGSTIQVPAGADQVPGLEKALDAHDKETK